MRIDLVVSAYRDDLAWVEKLTEKHPDVRVFLYDKCDLPARVAVSVRSQDCVTRLPNVGKCDHTYLHHIVEHYYGLADWTVFSTDYPFDGLPPGVTMEGALVPGPDVVCPAVCKVRDWGQNTRIDWAAMTNRPDRNGTNWAERFASGKITPANLSLGEWARKYVIGYEPGGEWPGYHPGSVYGVPKKAITYLPREFYARLREQLSHSVEPEEGHYLERLWLTIWTGQARYEEANDGAAVASA